MRLASAEENRANLSLKEENSRLKQKMQECQTQLAAAEAKTKELHAQIDHSVSTRSPSSSQSPMLSPRKSLDDPNSAVTSASLQQQFNELTEAIMRIPVRQRSSPTLSPKSSPRFAASAPNDSAMSLGSGIAG